jgi:CubicO group peptidase (beta-lactamase class C family)
MSDQLTEGQKAISGFFPGFWDHHGWGFGGQIVTSRHNVSAGLGAYGWSGGVGTGFVIDPEDDLIGIVLTQRMMRGPDDTMLYEDFFTLAHHAIDN